MRVLGVDTSRPAGGLAILSDGVRLSAAELPPGGHAETILVEIDRMLNDLTLRPKDIDLVAVAAGPGSFTGLRIGLAVAQGFATGVDCPVMGATTLDIHAAWARQVTEDENRELIPVLNARRGEVYYAAYRLERGTLSAAIEPAVGKPVDMAVRVDEFLAGVAAGANPVLCGDGVPFLAAHRPGWVHRFKTVFPPRAQDAAEMTARLGLSRFEQDGPGPFPEPVYIRAADARKPARAPGRAVSPTSGPES